MDVDSYINENLKAREKKPKTKAEKKAWLKARNLKTVKNPKTGKNSIPVHDKTVMLTGTRLSTKRERREEHESKEESKASFAKQREKNDVQVNTAVPCLTCLGLFAALVGQEDLLKAKNYKDSDGSESCSGSASSDSESSSDAGIQSSGDEGPGKVCC